MSDVLAQRLDPEDVKEAVAELFRRRGNGVKPTAVELPIPTAYDDSHMAIAFGRLIEGQYLYCSALGGWLRWDGRRWAPDEVEAVFDDCRRYVIDLGRHLFEVGADVSDVQGVARCRSRARLDAIVTLARRLEHVVARRADFDTHPWLFNCVNGTLDLRAKELRPHDPADRLTMLCPTRYVEDATDDVWERVVREALPEDKRRYLQRFAGYCLTGDVREKAILVPHGRTDTAKSTVVEPLATTLGDVAEGGYATAWDAEVVQRNPSVNRGEKVAKARAARLVVVGELEKGSRMADEFVKRFSGGDAVDAKALYKDSVTLRPQGKLVMHSNYVPRSADRAVHNRLRLVHFPNQIARPDRTLKEHLETSKAAHEAILAWAVRGCLEWQEHGLGETPWLDEELGRYAHDSDPVLGFVEACFVEDAGPCVTPDRAWKVYRAWADENVGRALKRRAFESALEERGYVRARVSPTDRRTIWQGLTLRSDDELPEVVRHVVVAERALGVQ